jgi:O-antigen/teichoic acid export membrane protein
MPSAVAAEPPAYGSPRTPAPPRVSRGDSLRSRTIRGTLWTTGGYGISLVLRLGINLVLTRLLAPPMFGVMSLVNIFIQGLQGFSDVGIGPAIIQSKRGDDPAFLNTAWTIQVLRGFALGGVSALIAWPVAKLYGDRQLLWLLPVAGSTALIAGFNSTAVFTLNRHLDVAKLTVLNLIGQVAGAFVMIGWALKWPSVWALVAGNVASAVITLGYSHTMLRGSPNRFHWDRTAVSEMIGFGRWIFVSTILTFLALQSDRLIFGQLISLHDLGVYSVAAMMATLPTSVLMRLGGAVIFPAYSRARGDAPSGSAAGTKQASPEFQRVFDRVRLPLLACGGLVAAAMIAGGPHIIQVLYDARYHDAGVMLSLLAIACWFQVLQISNGSALLALGSPRSIAASNVAKLSVLVVGIPLGFWAYGVNGAILAIILADVLKYGVTTVSARRKGLRGTATDTLVSLLVAASTLAAFGAARLAAGPIHTALTHGAEPVGKAAVRITKLASLGQLVIIGLVAGAVWVPVIVRSVRSRKAVA